MAALDEHRRAGRLDADEYHERSATAATARVRSVLDALFDDLPAPHPAFPPAGSPAGGGVAGETGPGRDEPTGSGPPARSPAGTDRPGTDRPGTDRPGTERPGTSPDRGDDLPELVAPLGAVLGRNAGKLSVLVPVVVVALEALIGFRFPLGLILIPLALAGLGWLGHRYGG